MAQSGSAPGLGPGGRRFESSHPDHPSHFVLRMAYASKRYEAELGEGCAPKPWRRRACRKLIMYYVYLIQSIGSPQQRYIGLTSNLKNRMKHHNSGLSKHTSKYKPWRLETYLAFIDKEKARQFEYYLKTGSGKAFANKRFW